MGHFLQIFGPETMTTRLLPKILKEFYETPYDDVHYNRLALIKLLCNKTFKSTNR